MSISNIFQRVALGLIITAALTISLTACGGGGGGATANPSDASYAPGGTSGANLLSVVLDTSASTQTSLAFILSLSAVDSGLDLATTVAGVSADLTYDSSWMTFSSITTSSGYAAAAQDQNNANKLVLGVTDVAAGTVAVLNFDIDTAATHNATLSMDNLAFLGPSGTIMPKHPMTANAGTVTNTPTM